MRAKNVEKKVGHGLFWVTVTNFKITLITSVELVFLLHYLTSSIQTQSMYGTNSNSGGHKVGHSHMYHYQHLLVFVRGWGAVHANAVNLCDLDALYNKHLRERE